MNRTVDNFADIAVLSVDCMIVDNSVGTVQVAPGMPPVDTSACIGYLTADCMTVDIPTGMDFAVE